MTPSLDHGKQTGNDAIVGIVRVRPSYGSFSCLSPGESTTEIAMCDNGSADNKRFTFDRVFRADSTQVDLFRTVGMPLVDNALKGYNGSIFAYGQTGSGKTYTTFGPMEQMRDMQSELRGVIPRALEYLFHTIRHQTAMTNKSFMCKCSFLEIYNEKIYDLLEPASQNLQVRQDMYRGVFVEGLREYSIESAAEALQVLNSGLDNRRVASTSMNRESSRSHAVFTVVIQSKDTKDGIPVLRQARINMVDLAGSERQKNTKTTGQALKEACKINQSLTTFGKVIMALVDMAQGKERHVPYRDSTLTYLLRDSLGGNTKTYIIANVSPEGEHYGETLSTLNYVYRAKMIRNKPQVNEDSLATADQLRAEVKRLQRELEAVTAGEAGNVSVGVVQELKRALVIANAELERHRCETGMLSKRVTDLENSTKQYNSSMQRLKMQMKMQLKMRDACLKKSMPESDIWEQLRQENNELREIIDQNPDVMRLLDENFKLQAELQRVKDLYPSYGEDNAVIAELREYISTLNAQFSEWVEANESMETIKQARPSNAQVELAQWRAQQQHEEAMEEMRRQLAQVESALAEKTTALEKLTADAASQRQADAATINELESLLKTAQLSNSVLGPMTQEAEQRVAELQRENAELGAHLREQKAKAEKVETLESTVETLQQQLDEATAVSAAAEVEKASYAEKLQILDRTLLGVRAALETAAAKWEEERQQLETRATESEVESGRCKEDLERVTGDLQSVQSDYDAQVAENEFMQKRLEEQQAELSKAKAELEDVAAEAQALAEKLDAEKRSASELREQLESRGEIEMKLGETMRANTELMENLSAAQTLLEQAQAKHAELAASLEEERTASVHLQGQIEHAQKAVRRYVDLLQQSREEYASAKTELAAVKEELAEARTSVSFLEGQRQALQRKLQTAEALKEEEAAARAKAVAEAMREVERIKDDMGSRLGHADEKLRQAEASIKSLEERMAHDNEEHRRAAAAMDAKLATLSSELEASHGETAQLRSAVDHKESQIRELRETLERDCSNLSAQEAAIRDLQIKVENQKQALESMEAERDTNVNMLHKKQAEFVQLSVEWKKTLERKNQQLDELREKAREHAAVAEEKAAVEEAAAALRQQIKEMKEQNAAANSELERLRSDVERLAAELRDSAAKEELEASRKECEQLQDERRSLKFQLQVASEDNEQLLAYYEGMFAANNENTMELERMKEERLRDSKEKELMQAELQKLRDENLVLAGHTNTSQKIKYLQQVKQDYNTLNIKIAKLEKYNVELKSALAQANGAHPLLRPGASTAGKENETAANAAKTRHSTSPGAKETAARHALRGAPQAQK